MGGISPVRDGTDPFARCVRLSDDDLHLHAVQSSINLHFSAEHGNKSTSYSFSGDLLISPPAAAGCELLLASGH
jgi:hypothetical protein